MTDNTHNTAPAGRWNPRFVAYANSVGKKPADLFNKGGFAMGMQSFIRRELSAFCATLDRKDVRLTSGADHDAFTGYLLAKYPEPVAQEAGA